MLMKKLDYPKAEVDISALEQDNLRMVIEGVLEWPTAPAPITKATRSWLEYIAYYAANRGEKLTRITIIAQFSVYGTKVWTEALNLDMIPVEDQAMYYYDNYQRCQEFHVDFPQRPITRQV